MLTGEPPGLHSVPHFPEEDSKLRATSLSVRRGGNCPNTLEVLQQLLRASAGGDSDDEDADDAATPAFSGLQAGRGTRIQTHLVSPLPGRASAATAQILSSFGTRQGPDDIDFSHCLYREGHEAPASSYVLRSAATGSRTLVNHNDLPEMTVEEFAATVESLQAGEAGRGQWWWHFEGRAPETTLECIRVLRRAYGGRGCGDDNNPADDDALRISVEVEKPGRQGLRELAAEADVVFYSRSWAEVSEQAEQAKRQEVVCEANGCSLHPSIPSRAPPSQIGRRRPRAMQSGICCI
jgi:ketohexokinase